MANYEAKTRSNYFSLKPGKTESELTTELLSCKPEGQARIVPDKESGKYAVIINGPCPEELPGKIRKLIAKDDACIITEIGHESMRYLVSTSIIVTADNVSCVNLLEFAKTIARETLENKDWDTRMDY